MSLIERIKLCFERLKNDDLNHGNDDTNKSILIFNNKQLNNFNECIICLENMGNNDELILVKCSHIYHKECLEKWIEKKNVCPLCDIMI